MIILPSVVDFSCAATEKAEMVELTQKIIAMKLQCKTINFPDRITFNLKQTRWSEKIHEKKTLTVIENTKANFICIVKLRICRIRKARNIRKLNSGKIRLKYKNLYKAPYHLYYVSP